MPTKLTNLFVRQVGLVDAGANQEADIVLTKRDESISKPEPRMTEDLTKQLADAQAALAEAKKEVATPATHIEPFKEKYEKSQQELEAVRGDLRKQLDEATKELEDSKTEVTKIRQARRREKFIKRAQELDHLPGASADDFAEILDRVESALTEKQFGALNTRLTSWNAIIEQSKIFSEVGRDGVAAFSGPEGQLHALAMDLQTRDSKKSYAQAYDQAMRENPALYKRYLAEKEK